MEFRFAFSALTELREAVVYYEQRENGLGKAFLDEIEETLIRILLNPSACTRYPPERDAVERIDFRLVSLIRSG